MMWLVPQISGLLSTLHHSSDICLGDSLLTGAKVTHLSRRLRAGRIPESSLGHPPVCLLTSRACPLLPIPYLFLKWDSCKSFSVRGHLATAEFSGTPGFQTHPAHGPSLPSTFPPTSHAGPTSALLHMPCSSSWVWND